MTVLSLASLTIIGIVAISSCGNSSHKNMKLKTAEFKVYGNCGMCEKTIEGSLNDVEGIDEADWDKETKLISITFDSLRLNEEELKSKIATVGYDTDSKRASDKVYYSLPGCCQYDRP